MGGIAFCSICARLVTLPFLVLVHTPADAWLAVAIQTAAAVLGSTISLALVWRKKSVGWQQPSTSGIKKTFVDGWHVFISTVAISAYTNTNVLVLGVLSGSEAVGRFVATDKVRQAAQNSTSSITQAVYPHINALMLKDRDAAFRFLIKLVWVFGGLTFAMSLLILTFAEPIVNVVLGPQYVSSSNVLRLLAFLPFLVASSNIFGIQAMLSLGMQRQFSSIVLWSAIINVCLIVPLSYLFRAEGAAASILITETVVTAQMALALNRTEFVSTRASWKRRAIRSC